MVDKKAPAEAPNKTASQTSPKAQSKAVAQGSAVAPAKAVDAASIKDPAKTELSQAVGPDVVREVGEILSSVKVLKKKLAETETDNKELRGEVARLIARQQAMDAEMTAFSAAAGVPEVPRYAPQQTPRQTVEMPAPTVDTKPITALPADERSVLLAQLKEEQQRHLARAKAFDQAIQEASRRDQRLRDEIDRLKDWHDQLEINNAGRDLKFQQQTAELQQSEMRNQMLVQQLAFYEREQSPVAPANVDLEKIRGRLRDVITTE